MGTVAVSSPTPGQCAPPRRSCQIFLRRHEALLPPTKCCGLPRSSCSAKRRSSAIRIGRVTSGFGAVEWRGLRLESVRTVVVRVQEEEKEQREIEKVEEKSPGPSNVHDKDEKEMQSDAEGPLLAFTCSELIILLVVDRIMDFFCAEGEYGVQNLHGYIRVDFSFFRDKCDEQ